MFHRFFYDSYHVICFPDVSVKDFELFVDELLLTLLHKKVILLGDLNISNFFGAEAYNSRTSP